MPQGEIGQAIQNAQHVMLAAHIRPDGDAVGALLGLGLALSHAGKKVQMVLADGVPINLRHLPGSAMVQKRAEPGADLTAVLDCSDMLRTGGVLGSQSPDLNIDHHITNLNFGRLNLVQPEAVATSAILAEYLPEWGLKIDSEIASCLLTGIITDTIGFRTSNMTPKALRLAANLMECGANLPELYRVGLVQKSFEAARYWGFGLGRLQRLGSLLWTTVSQADRREASYQGNDDADLINILTTIEGDVVVVFNEQRGGKVKVSWRARPGLDISGLALQFGGGGHPAAAGAEMSGGLDDVQQRVLQATQTFLDQAAPPNGGNHTAAKGINNLHGEKST